MDNNKFISGMKQYFENQIKLNPDFGKEFFELAKQFERFPVELQKFSEDIAIIGWFTTSESYLPEMKAAFNISQEKLDFYMIEEINHNYKTLKSNLLDAHKNRQEILNCAFKLHETKNWIGSIPLFLSQIEGIFSENIGAFLFSEHAKRKAKLEERFNEKSNKYMPYLYSPFVVETQFSANICSSSKTKKMNGPNRNGILHGSRKHLDYGSDLNSYKCISLLSYISMVFTEIEKT